jgi:pre-mRNA-splicing helicase BRR2
MPKHGRTIQQYIFKFPRLELEAYVQPLTRTMLRIELDLKVHKNFEWDQKYHGTAEPFWVLIHDSDSETILHTEQFMLRESTCHEEHRLSFTVNLHEPMPPQYFVKVISDRWMHAETSLPISFKHLILPDKFPAPTQVLEMYPRKLRDLKF